MRAEETQRMNPLDLLSIFPIFCDWQQNVISVLSGNHVEKDEEETI
jgi:hypothetical protein